jgi:hypothetical protein
MAQVFIAAHRGLSVDSVIGREMQNLGFTRLAGRLLSEVNLTMKLN